jgi:hypothetical protein
MALDAHQLLHIKALITAHPNSNDEINQIARKIERGQLSWVHPDLPPFFIHDWFEKPERRDELLVSGKEYLKKLAINPLMDIDNG